MLRDISSVTRNTALSMRGKEINHYDIFKIKSKTTKQVIWSNQGSDSSQAEPRLEVNIFKLTVESGDETYGRHVTKLQSQNLTFYKSDNGYNIIFLYCMLSDDSSVTRNPALSMRGEETNLSF